MYLDFKMDPGSKLSQSIPNKWNGFIYTLKGKGSFGKHIHLEIVNIHFYL